MQHSQRYCHFFKCILKVVFCKSVQHRPRFCLGHLNCVQMSAFHFYLQSGKQQSQSQASRVGEGRLSCFWSKVPWWKRKYETGRCRNATVSSFVAKVRGEVFASHSSMWNWLLGLPGQIFCEQSPWCQRKWIAWSWLCSLPVSPFPVSLSLDMPFEHPCTAHAFFSEGWSNHCQGLRRTLSEICTGFGAHSLILYQIHRDIPSGLIHDSK
jgi:hypothetical protein